MYVYELGTGKAAKSGAKDVRILLIYIAYTAILFTRIGSFWSRKDLSWYIEMTLLYSLKMLLQKLAYFNLAAILIFYCLFWPEKYITYLI